MNDDTFSTMECSLHGTPTTLHDGVAEGMGMILSAQHLLLVGNGGSAAITSHIAADAFKAGLRPLVFTDPALMSCLANDLGWPEVYAAAVERYGDRGDLLIAISSSGESPNIIRAINMAARKGLATMTLSGFQPNNPVRLLGELAFYVPSDSYGLVEITHLTLLHTMMERVKAMAREP